MRKRTEHAGFTPPVTRKLGRERRAVAYAELVATLGLAIGTIIAATVITVGIARADAATNVIDQESSLFAVALLLGLAFIAIGGLAILPEIHLPHLPRRTRRG
jgi:hypothetical protein